MAIRQTENPDIDRKFYTDQQKQVMASAKNSAVLHALISGPRKTITIDVEGTPVEIYEPSPRQLLPLQKVTVEVMKYRASLKLKGKEIKKGKKPKEENESDEDESQLKEIMDSVIQGYGSLESFCDNQDRLLADLTVDPALTYDAFSSGLIPEHKKALILNGIRNWSKEQEKILKEKAEIASFRDRRRRSGSSRSHATDGLDPGTDPGDAGT